jgi:starch synthase
MAKRSTKDPKGTKDTKDTNDAKDAKDTKGAPSERLPRLVKSAKPASPAKPPTLAEPVKAAPQKSAAKPTPEKPVAEKRVPEKPVAETAASAAPVVEKPSTQKGVSDKRPAARTAQKPPVEKPAAAKVSKPRTDRTPRTGEAKAAPVAAAKPVERRADALDVLMVTSEARPFAKTGGLADVCGALPLALARLGHRVTIVLPKYRTTKTDGAAGEAAQVPFGLHSYPVRFIEQPVADGVTAVLIDAPSLYDRDGLYGDQNGEFGDNAFRFAVLSRGALEYARIRGRRPSVIHAHDWQAGLVPVYARTVLRDDPVIGGVRIVLTIHNLAFQGGFDPKELNWIGLGQDLYTPQLLEFYGRASTLKGGVVFSDVITTVSPTYAREIVTPDFGFGFDGILRSRTSDLVGILNGIDIETWDPRTDRQLPQHFDADSLDRKQEIKRALLEYVGLPRDEWSMGRPLMGIVTRLTHQKGCDLFASAAERLMGFDATWIMLGSGDSWCEDLWRQLAARFPDRVAARIGFDDHLAHLIEGGADMFVMPSWYEPCGLNQMYSLRYGTLPIVRATGGLQDTVVDELDEAADQANGFKFQHYTAEGLIWAIERAIGVFRNDRERWRAMQRRGMGRDFSWDVSAREYVKVYRS